jgi:hypothetical protein
MAPESATRICTTSLASVGGSVDDFVFVARIVFTLSSSSKAHPIGCTAHHTVLVMNRRFVSTFGGCLWYTNLAAVPSPP